MNASETFYPVVIVTWKKIPRLKSEFDCFHVTEKKDLVILYLWCSTVYICSSFWLLRVKSCDFSHAVKERTACKPEQIHKKTNITTQHCSRLSFWVKRIVIFRTCPALQPVLSFSAWDKTTWLNSQQPKTIIHDLEDLCENLLEKFDW